MPELLEQVEAVIRRDQNENSKFQARLDFGGTTQFQGHPSQRSPKPHRPTLLPEHAERLIRRRAYELYEKRGRQDGHAVEDWLRAQAEILATLLRGTSIK